MFDKSLVDIKIYCQIVFVFYDPDTRKYKT